ncbi:MAG: hypothetical protein ACOCWS_03850 [Alkalispirochaetaceae bacterium]
MERNESSIESIIEGLRHRADLTEEELKAQFRALVMQTHPDRPGGSEEEFIRVREEFSRLEKELRTAASRKTLFADFDPAEIPREQGLEEPFSDRSALYASLQRYMSAGLYRFKIRSNPSLRNRNSRIIKSVLYWGERYDPEFLRLFSDHLRQQNNFAAVTGEHRVYFFVRKVFIKGVDWALQYHRHGRPGTAKVARDWLTYATVLSGTSDHPATEALRALAGWYIRELEVGREAGGRLRG